MGRFSLITSFVIVFAYLQPASVYAADAPQIQVVIPQSLQKPGGYVYSAPQVLFGSSGSFYIHGGSIQQEVYYAKGATLCSTANAHTENWYPIEKDERGNPFVKNSPYVVLVDRIDLSSCPVEHQVRTAMTLGATGVLIANDRCRCADTECESSYNHACSDNFSFDDTSDGTGVGIDIPAFLILKQDADTIKASLQKKEHVEVEMAFPALEPIRQVKYGIWMDPMHPFEPSMLLSFKEGAVALGSSAVFTPHENIIDGQLLGCLPQWGKTQCDSFCTNNNRYCATNPYAASGNSTVSGSEIVAESLRRLCVWQHYGQDGIGTEWWDYVLYFSNHCHDPTTHVWASYSEECISNGLDQAGVDKNNIASCMEISGGLETDGENTLLQTAMLEGAGNLILPTIIVSVVHDLEPVYDKTQVFATICSTFAPQFQPHVCQTCEACYHSFEACISSGGICPRNNASSSQRGFFSAAVSLLMFVLVASLAASIGFFLYQGRDRVNDRTQYTTASQQIPTVAHGDSRTEQEERETTAESEMSNFSVS